MIWFLLVVLVAGLLVAWTVVRRRRASGPSWMRHARNLGFRVVPNVSPPKMTRTRDGRTHLIGRTPRPFRGEDHEVLDVAATVNQVPLFRFFASVGAAAELTPFLPPLDVDGYGTALGDDAARASAFLMQMERRLTRLAAGGILEVDETRAVTRARFTSTEEELARAIQKVAEAAAYLEVASARVPPAKDAPLRWTGNFYEGEVERARQRVRLSLEFATRGPEVDLSSLGDASRRVDAAEGHLNALRSKIASRLAKEAAPWFEDAGLGKRALASELVLDSIRLSEASPETTLYLRHNVFAGHFVEVAISADGALVDVSLMG